MIQCWLTEMLQSLALLTPSVHRPLLLHQPIHLNYIHHHLQNESTFSRTVLRLLHCLHIQLCLTCMDRVRVRIQLVVLPRQWTLMISMMALAHCPLVQLVLLITILPVVRLLPFIQQYQLLFPGVLFQLRQKRAIF